MKNNTQLKRMVKKYLEHPRAVTQNELARRIGMGNSTMTAFLKTGKARITAEQEGKLLDVISPEERDPVCVAGKLLTSLHRKYFSKAEIAVIAINMSQKQGEYE